MTSSTHEQRDNSFPKTIPWRVTIQRQAQNPSGIFDWTAIDWPKPAETPTPKPDTEVHQPVNGTVVSLASLIGNRYPVFESLLGHLNRGEYDNLRATSHTLRAVLPNLGDPSMAKTRLLLKSGCQEPQLQYPDRDLYYPHLDWESFANTSLRCPQSNPQSTVKLMKCTECASNGKEHWFCQLCHTAARLALNKKFDRLKNGRWRCLCDECVEYKLKYFLKERAICGYRHETTCNCPHTFQKMLADDQAKCSTCTASPLFQWEQRVLFEETRMNAWKRKFGTGFGCFLCLELVHAGNWRRQGYSCVNCEKFCYAPVPPSKLDGLFKC